MKYLTVFATHFYTVDKSVKLNQVT